MLLSLSFHKIRCKTLLRVFCQIDMCDNAGDDQQQACDGEPVHVHQIALEITENQKQRAQYDEGYTNQILHVFTCVVYSFSAK